ncbi:MAG: enoyl-CoA hydratase/isomerase family protein [Candidatus Obscuribacterales bacterium]|nr:enoyl-CoA hydratase/isomerase family protein [Candidatus Obscuribacterales bacterium]
MTKYQHIVCEQKAGVGVLTLSSEPTLNSLTVPMIKELHEVLKQWKEDSSVACVFLQGAGEKAFCAGGDVRKLHDAIVQQGKDAPGKVPADCLEFFTQEYRLDYEIHCYPKPIVVWADGIVMGGGIGLAAGASHRVVTDKSKLAMPEITIGLYPDVGGTWFLNKMPTGFGLYLGMTGTRINAADCLYLNLADYYIASSSKQEVIDTLRKASWESSNKANAEIVTDILQSISAKHQCLQSAAEAHQSFVSEFANVDSVAQFKELLVNCEQKDEWISAGIVAFESGSPSSAHIIFEQLKRGKNLSLEAVFQSELNLSAQCTIHPDFVEGVRALLVDKDKMPKWQPATLEEITNSWVESHFVPLWKDSEHPLKELGKNEALCQK